MKKILIKLIKIYQKFISPLKISGCCRFIPTCSEYAIQAIDTHGSFKGCFLALKRILRCHPLCKGGYDPVPERKQKF
ncbi:MAG: membrane protein insertion efficiency factor YidD [Clostridia bacterium]|nr:membrane protein insertion efficiency factor YidD [Clostridia bacterium]